jgi:uncharacterized protein (TIGR02996 family)
MIDHDALLAAIPLDPPEDVPRLAFEDCLYENRQHDRVVFRN